MNKSNQWISQVFHEGRWKTAGSSKTQDGAIKTAQAAARKIGARQFRYLHREDWEREEATKD